MHHQLLGRLLALSQRFNVTTEHETGIEWKLGDLSIEIRPDSVLFRKGSSTNNLSVIVPNEIIQVKDGLALGHPASFHLKFGDFNYVNVQLERLSPEQMQSDEFKTIDDILENFTYGDVFDDLNQDEGMGFDMIKVLANQDLKLIDKHL